MLTQTQVIQIKFNPIWLDIGGGSPKPSASQIDSLATQVSKTPKQSATFRSSTGERVTLRSKPGGTTLDAEIRTSNGKTIRKSEPVNRNKPRSNEKPRSNPRELEAPCLSVNPDNSNTLNIASNNLTPREKLASLLEKIRTRGFDSMLGVEEAKAYDCTKFKSGTRGAEIPDIEVLDNISISYNKHIPKKYHLKMTEKEFIKSTGQGKASYYHPKFTPKEIIELEANALKRGRYVHNGQGESYIVYEANDVIGASNGLVSEYIRLDISAVTNKGKLTGGTYHGHPITEFEYLKLIKSIK